MPQERSGELHPETVQLVDRLDVLLHQWDAFRNSTFIVRIMKFHVQAGASKITNHSPVQFFSERFIVLPVYHFSDSTFQILVASCSSFLDYLITSDKCHCVASQNDCPHPEAEQ